MPSNWEIKEDSKEDVRSVNNSLRVSRNNMGTVETQTVLDLEKMNGLFNLQQQIGQQMVANANLRN